MTTRVIKTTDTEAKLILEDKLRFIFRSEKTFCKAGDIFEFLVVKNGKPARNEIDGKKFVVTVVFDDRNAPLQEGFTIIGFRRLR